MKTRKNKKTKRMQLGGNPKLIQFKGLLTTLLKQVLYYVGQNSGVKKETFIKNNNMSGPQLITTLNSIMQTQKISYCHFPPDIMNEANVTELYNDVFDISQRPEYLQAIEFLKLSVDKEENDSEDIKAMNLLSEEMVEEIESLIIESFYLTNFFTEQDTEHSLGPEGTHEDITYIDKMSIIKIFVDAEEIHFILE